MKTKKQQKIFNNTSFKLEDIYKFHLLGATKNNWRQRDIYLFQHPDEQDKVVSVGTTFDGSMIVVAVEGKDEWTTALEYAARGKVYVSQ